MGQEEGADCEVLSPLAEGSRRKPEPLGSADAMEDNLRATLQSNRA